ncbi:MAG: hypothetical protein CBB97_18065 [Candidatus Endolissoclinum sp. TMED37]|nr:MAG: hypothetical protein CBB97_18065 [Candidatus Endolissoclinum sp. TMED37]|tara:strand:+ start:231 stop:1118 length:888 start_codon:yes stop_codon:yes gene_type:complete
MSNFDLDIDNYNLKDLLNLFKLNYTFGEIELKQAKKMVLKLHPDKSNLDKEIFVFFNKAYKIIEKIYFFKASKQCAVRNVEYENVDIKTINNGDKKILINKLKGKSVKEFNEWFNKMFLKVKMSEENYDKGYGDWFKSDEDLETQEAKNMSEFGNIFNNRKNYVKSLVVKKDLEGIGLSSGYSLDRNNNRVEHSSGIFSKLQYEDLKKAHTETVVPVTQEDYNSVKKYNSVDDLERERGVNTNPMNKIESIKYLNSQQTKMEETSTNLAYELMKRNEEAEKKQKEWWKNLRQLQN